MYQENKLEVSNTRAVEPRGLGAIPTGTKSAEPKAFELISQCHRMIDQIESKTKMLIVPMPQNDQSEKVQESPLYEELENLLEHLEKLAGSYRL